MLYNWFTHGKLERTDGSSVTEGINNNNNSTCVCIIM